MCQQTLLDCLQFNFKLLLLHLILPLYALGLMQMVEGVIILSGIDLMCKVPSSWVCESFCFLIKLCTFVVTLFSLLICAITARKILFVSSQLLEH